MALTECIGMILAETEKIFTTRIGKGAGAMGLFFQKRRAVERTLRTSTALPAEIAITLVEVCAAALIQTQAGLLLAIKSAKICSAGILLRVMACRKSGRVERVGVSMIARQGRDKMLSAQDIGAHSALTESR